MPSNSGQSQDLEELKTLFAQLAEEAARLMDLQADYVAAVGKFRGASRSTLVDELKSKIQDRERELKTAAFEGSMSTEAAACEVVTIYKQAIEVLLAERKKLIS